MQVGSRSLGSVDEATEVARRMDAAATLDGQATEIHVGADLLAESIGRDDVGAPSQSFDGGPLGLECLRMRRRVGKLQVAAAHELSIHAFVRDQRLDQVAGLQGLEIQRRGGLLAKAPDQFGGTELVAWVDDAAVAGGGTEAHALCLDQCHRRSLAGQLAGSSDARVATADHDHIHRVRERPPAPVRKRRRLLLPKHSPLDPFKGRFVAALCHHERVALAGGGQRRVALALGAMRRASDLDRRTVRRQSSEGRVREAPVRGAANSCRVKAGWWGSPPSYRRDQRRRGSPVHLRRAPIPARSGHT